MRKKILITGSGGFIASHLIPKINKERNFILYGVDKKKIKKNYRIRFFKLDIASEKFLNKFKDIKFDCIIHLAAFSKPSKAEKKIKEAYFSNVIGTANVIKLALKKKNCRLIFTSAGAIYNNIPKYTPIDEKHSIDPLQSVYATTKRLCENLILDYIKNRNLNAIFFRLFNTFGPKQEKNFLIPSFIQKAKKSSFKILNGNIIRDFNHVDNVVDILLLSINSHFKGGPINIASGNGIKISKIARFIANYFKVNFIDLKKKETFGPKVQIADIYLLRKIFRYKYKKKFKEGIIQTIKSYL